MHEGLSIEAQALDEKIKKVFGFDNSVQEVDLTQEFRRMQGTPGFCHFPFGILEKVPDLKSKKVMLLTGRDLYAGDSEQDDWIFGFHAGNLMVVSTARMKGPDNKPLDRLEVPEELYLARMVFTGIHEIGHDVVKAGHYLSAVWINAITGHQLEMGPHCTDNRCVMYEVVDIIAPPPEEGHMLLGDQKKFDTGIDEHLKRMQSDYFCERCKPSIEIPDAYR
ncbi:hypothetical protein HYV84_05055 [Candidatus Woesearchaeota archaeon]|nr:hypothetical protein [Candidatus Woesearchaeota archaeon]